MTSDGPTMELYSEAGWTVHEVELSERETLEGWRVRQSIRMLSTVMDDEAADGVGGKRTRSGHRMAHRERCDVPMFNL